MRTSDLGGRLRRLRAERGLTQQELAAPRYTSAYVSTIEAGKRSPSEAALTHFAEKLGVTLRELATGVPAKLEPEILLRLQDGWEALYAGRYNDAERAFRSAERDAKLLEGSDLRGRALIGRARCAERQGATDDALRLYEKALEEFVRNGSVAGRIDAIAGLAKCHQMSGEARLAAHLLESFLIQLDREALPDPTALMRANAALIWPYMELGLERKASEAAKTALTLQNQVDDPAAVAAMHVNVARSLLNDGKVKHALESLRKAEDLYEGLNWRTEIARARMSRGIVYAQQEEFAAAEAELRSALGIFREVGFAREEARALNEIARLERLSGNRSEARSLARRALELLKEMRALPELALAHRELALAIGDDDLEEAAGHLRAAAELYQACGEALHAADTLRLLGDVSILQRVDSACDVYRKGLLLLAGMLDRTDEIADVRSKVDRIG